MEKAHEGMNIQPAHFDAIVTHQHDALAHYGVSESDIGQALEKEKKSVHLETIFNYTKYNLQEKKQGGC